MIFIGNLLKVLFRSYVNRWEEIKISVKKVKTHAKRKLIHYAWVLFLRMYIFVYRAVSIKSSL